MKKNALTRRQFVARGSAAVAGVAFAGAALADDKPATIGSGAYTFELVPGWGGEPEANRFLMGCGIVVDSKDRIYVHSNANKCMFVFDRDGKVVNDWGTEWAAKGHGLYWHKEGHDEFLYYSVLGPYNRIIKTDLSGKIVMQIGKDLEKTANSAPFNFNMPTDVAIAPNGDIWVCEGYGGNMLHVFTKKGEFIRTVGKPGSGPGEFKTCHGIWVDTRKGEPEIYVADRHNDRLQIFNMGGELKREVKNGIVRNPCCFYQVKDKLYIPDLDHRVTIIDKDDQPVAQLGDGKTLDGKENITDFTFKTPHALTVDSRGDMYVVEWVQNARLRKFRHVKAA